MKLLLTMAAFQEISMQLAMKPVIGLLTCCFCSVLAYASRISSSERLAPARWTKGRRNFTIPASKSIRVPAYISFGVSSRTACIDANNCFLGDL